MQRGTIHEWINESDDWVRMFFVMVGEWRLWSLKFYISGSNALNVVASEKVRVGDKELDTEFR